MKAPLYALASLPLLTLAAVDVSDTKDRTLVPLAFDPLPLGSITPLGWLKDQLQLMADGLAGHEHDFYLYVKHSTWLGGEEEYSDLREGTPYWFNGLVPLAYGLGDARLKDQVHSAMEHILANASSDGWIGPEEGGARNFWGRMPLFLGMTALADANATWSDRIVPALHKFSGLMNTMLHDNYTGYLPQAGDVLSPDDMQWGRVRHQDMLITLQWLLEQHRGDEKENQALWENMQMLHEAGLNWEDFYNEAAYFGQGFDGDLNLLNINLTEDNFPFEHGVNVAQGLKAPAVTHRFTHNASLLTTAHNGVNWTITFHGSASGSILADERLVGLAPYSGSEFCTAVEMLYSLAYLYQAVGDTYYADLAERTAFNVVPAMATPDWWGHQYMAQPNQPFASNLTETPFWNTNSWGTTYGLEPNYPCCTVNHPQGLGKFLGNSWVRVGRRGLAHALLGPSDVRVEIDDGEVSVRCETAYPFQDQLVYTIDAPGAMEMYLRVPEWAADEDACIDMNGKKTPVSPDPVSGLHKISIPNKGRTSLTYTLPGSIRTTPRANDTVAVYRGALLYALEVTHTTTSTPPKPYTNPGFGEEYYNASYAPPQSRDWQYHNTSAWNYAIDPSTMTYHRGSEVANPVFAPGGPPGWIEAMACEIEWPMAFSGSVAGFPPTGKDKKCMGEKRKVRLVPYGSAKTGMAEVPAIDLSGV